MMILPVQFAYRKFELIKFVDNCIIKLLVHVVMITATQPPYLHWCREQPANWSHVPDARYNWTQFRRPSFPPGSLSLKNIREQLTNALFTQVVYRFP